MQTLTDTRTAVSNWFSERWHTVKTSFVGKFLKTIGDTALVILKVLLLLGFVALAITIFWTLLIIAIHFATVFLISTGFLVV